MMKLKEDYLCSALEQFIKMVRGKECSKQDILHYVDESKYILDRYGVSIGKKLWLTKEEASGILGISTSTFDRLVLKGVLPRGKKIVGQNKLVWKAEQIEQLNRMKLLKEKS